jgi:hypothetical protein
MLVGGARPGLHEADSREVAGRLGLGDERHRERAETGGTEEEPSLHLLDHLVRSEQERDVTIIGQRPGSWQAPQAHGRRANISVLRPP